MSNMKDYMMWLDDQGLIECIEIGECIIPEDVNIMDIELIERYQNDTAWHRPETQENTVSNDHDKKRTEHDVRFAINSRTFTVNDAIDNMNEVMEFFDDNEYDDENELRVARETLILLTELTSEYGASMFTQEEIELTHNLGKVAIDVVIDNSNNEGKI